MADPGVAHEREVRATVQRVASRARLADALGWTARALVVLGVAAALAIAAIRFGGVRQSVALLCLALGAVATAVGVALLARPVPTLVAASLADRALGLRDRLTSAVTFLEVRAPTDLQRAAIADAARLGASVDARRVIALRLPTAVRWLPAVLVVLAAVSLVRLPAPTPSVAPKVVKPKLVVEPDALSGELDAIRKLARESHGKDPQLAALAKELEKLLTSVDQQKLSRQEVFTELARLEATYVKKQPALAKPSDLLAPATKALAQAKATRALADALKKDDLEAAKAELDKIAAAAQKRDKDKQEEREMEKALEEASRNLDEQQKKADAERDRKIEQLREEERRLKKQQQDRPDEDTERRLQRNKRELERLEREKEEQAEQRRQLQRLSKDMQEAAEELRKKMSPEAMKKMSEELGKMQDEIRKLQSSAEAQKQLAELKEMLRRAGRVEVCTGSGCSDGRGQDGKGQDGKGQDGKGQDGKGQPKGGRGDKLKDFDKRAGGQTETLILGGKDGETTVMLPLPMGGTEQGPPQGGGPGDGEPRGPGDGIGKEHDDAVLGDPTALKTQQKLIRATGAQGKGPSRSETILEASERGFSGKGYGKVFKDYSAVVEEVMSQEGVPPGYRYYVKRYFQLIRPRE